VSRAANALSEFLSIDQAQEHLISKRRAAWPTARDVLLGVLKPFAASVSGERRAYVQAFQQFENFGSVQFWFGSIKTGILKREGTGASLGIERGAAIVFGQGESGRVHVTFYPFETELPNMDCGSRDGHLSTVVEPEVVTAAWVDGQVASFIDWAQRTTYRAVSPKQDRKIGFQVEDERGGEQS
jgi:hypothetical protein